MNEYIDDSRIDDKILDIVLPAEKIFDEDKGESTTPPIRYGRLDDTAIYKNRSVVNTRNGQKLTIPHIKMYLHVFDDLDSMLIIDIFDRNTHNLLKKFTIKSSQNEYTLNDMRNIIDAIKSLIESDSASVTNLIKLIRTYPNLVFNEVAQ